MIFFLKGTWGVWCGGGAGGPGPGPEPGAAAGDGGGQRQQLSHWGKKKLLPSPVGIH